MSANFMPQSRLPLLPCHTAIIMDGNGRWASAKGLSRCAGHRAGSHALRRIVECAPSLGIRILTLYAFSSDNWKRPVTETDALMELLAFHLLSEAEQCGRDGVRLTMIGRRDRLPPSVLQAAEHAESKTAAGTNLHLRLAVDYSGRQAILSALSKAAGTTSEALGADIGEDVDLLIRTGGEQRLSDFLLWECAYAELVFTEKMWPDFAPLDLAQAIRIFQSRERRFGQAPLGSLGQLWSRNGSGAISHLRGDRWLR